MQPWVWNVDRVFFKLPIIGFEVYWYGLFFALGAFLAQKPFYRFLKDYPKVSKAELQNGVFYLIVGLVLGARIFDILFYQNLFDYLRHPIEIFNLRAGGLASHGGVLGFFGVLFCLSKKWKIPFLTFLSGLIPSVGIIAVFIRLGNFFNHEILGTASSGPFSVLFMHPLDGSAIYPRHPVQLYEAVCYGVLTWFFWKPNGQVKAHVGKALIGFFSARLILEFFKEEQSVYLAQLPLKMGALLSLPMILAGVILVVSSMRNTRDLNQSSQRQS